MATPFSSIYDSFLTKIDDPSLLSMAQVDLEDIMYNWLITAITHFKKCKKDITDFDSTNRTFNVDLDIFEQDILSEWMKYSYLDKKIYRENLLKQSLSNKDYAMYSQANHLKELLDLKEITYKEAVKKVTNYLYDNVDYSDLG